MDDIGSTADQKFFGGVTRNWNHEINSITQVVDDKTPSYRRFYLTQKYNEA